MLTQLCSIPELALASVSWYWSDGGVGCGGRLLPLLVRDGLILLWVRMGSQSLEGKGNQRERAGQGSFWQHLKMCSNKREEVGVLARGWPSPQACQSCFQGCWLRGLGQWLGLQRSCRGGEAWKQHLCHPPQWPPLRSGPPGAGIPSSAPARTKFLVPFSSHIRLPWSGHWGRIGVYLKPT